MAKGLVYVFTGEGKGKTSAALGVATRAALIGKKVVWISFYKGKDWDLAEKSLEEKLENIEMFWVGKGFRINKPIKELTNQQVKIAKIAGHQVVVDTASEEEHKTAAQDGLNLAQEKLAEQPFLLVLDEVLNVVSEGLVESDRAMELLNKRGKTHVVLTGRAGTEPFQDHGPARRLLAGADLVTECKKIKHPYDKGVLAVRGLDF